MEAVQGYAKYGVVECDSSIHFSRSMAVRWTEVRVCNALYCHYHGWMRRRETGKKRGYERLKGDRNESKQKKDSNMREHDEWMG
jgi:hypothetical protein